MKDRFETFTGLIARIGRSIRKIKNQEMAAYNLKGPQVFCLYYLCTEDGPCASELCARCGEDKATISRALADLEQSGFITGEGGYRGALHLTQQGRLAAGIIEDKVNAVFERAGLSEAERDTFYRQLTSICAQLERMAEERI